MQNYCEPPQPSLLRVGIPSGGFPENAKLSYRTEYMVLIGKVLNYSIIFCNSGNTSFNFLIDQLAARKYDITPAFVSPTARRLEIADAVPATAIEVEESFVFSPDALVLTFDFKWYSLISADMRLCCAVASFILACIGRLRRFPAFRRLFLTVFETASSVFGAVFNILVLTQLIRSKQLPVSNMTDVWRVINDCSLTLIVWEGSATSAQFDLDNPCGNVLTVNSEDQIVERLRRDARSFYVSSELYGNQLQSTYHDLIRADWTYVPSPSPRWLILVRKG